LARTFDALPCRLKPCVKTCLADQIVPKKPIKIPKEPTCLLGSQPPRGRLRG